MVQKYLIFYRFDFLDRFFFRDFLMIPYELFHSFSFRTEWSEMSLYCAKKMFLRSDLLKLFLKKKRKINEFFRDTTVFYD